MSDLLMKAILILPTIGIFFVGIVYVFVRNRKIVDKSPYIKVKMISNAEKEFFKLLNRLYGDKYFIFAQVRLSSLVNIPKGKFSWKLFNPIGAKSVDFVLMDKESLDALLVIELDDKTHELPERIKRDKFLNKVLADAGVSLLRVRLQRKYQVANLKDRINNLIRNVG